MIVVVDGECATHVSDREVEEVALVVNREALIVRENGTKATNV